MPKTKAEIFAEIWPSGERPSGLQCDATVNSFSAQDLAAFHSATIQQRAADNAASSQEIVRDGNILPTPYTGTFIDNSTSVLHPARFERMPLESPLFWFYNVPVERRPVIVNAIPFEFVGADNQIPAKTLKIMHNRTKELTLDMFTHAKLNSYKKDSSESDTNECIYQLKDAVDNFATASQQLFPLDPTPIIMYRVLSKYRWAAAVLDGSARRQIIINFFNSVMRQNVNRASRQAAPICFAEMETTMRTTFLNDIRMPGDTALLGRVAPPPPAVTAQQFSGGVQRGGRGGRGNRGHRGGRGGQQGGRQAAQPQQQQNEADKRVPIFEGKGVCYKFNRFGPQGCDRPKEDGGCRSKDNTGHWAHVCNQLVTEKDDFCYQNHSRTVHSKEYKAEK